MKFAFLIHNMYGVGGTNRAVLNLATALVEIGHQVEIASVFRRVDRPMFAIDDRIPLVPLVDTRPRRPDRSDPTHREPSLLVPESEEFHAQYSRLTDERIIAWLAATDADVVVGTRPGLNLAVARYGPAQALRVAQEHMTQDLIDEDLKEQIALWYERIDLALTVTHADAEAFRTGNPVPRTRIEVLPNSSPEPAVVPADGGNRIVVAAGRLDPIKRYDLLIAAFGRVVKEFPDWRLRIYGDGVQRPALTAQIRELGLYDQVHLMGRRDDMSTEWVKGSIAAVSSERESFGMTIVEAMRLGLPVVSTDCPVGPREIIQHGADGLLVPPDDVDAYAQALRTVMGDDALRLRMAATAVRNAARFDPETLASSFADTCAVLLAGRARARVGATTGPVPRPRSARSARARGADRIEHPDLVRRLGDPVLRGIAGSDLARRASMGALVRLGRIRRVRATSARLQKAIRRRVPVPVGGPVVDCVVLPDGGIRWEVEADRPVTEGTLLLRERDTGVVRRLPLTPRQEGRTHVGVLGPDALTEGLWNVYLERAKGAPIRLRPRQLDTRVLAAGYPTQADPAGAPGIRAHVPYRTTDGFVGVRSWVRPEHAEVRRVDLDGDRISIELSWCGPEGTGPGEALLRRRGDRYGMLPVPSRETPDGRLLVTVPVPALVDQRLGRYEDWDLLLRPAGADRDIRPGLLVDDVVDKKSTYNYPEIYLDDDPGLDLVEENPMSLLRVRPYYTRDSELSIVVVDRP